jgi:hypothetical protein
MPRSWWVIGALVIAASCKKTPAVSEQASSSTNPSSASETCGEMSCVDLGRAHERGTGRPRDYHAAAAAYRRGCDAGDAVACRLVADAIMLQRSQEPMAASDAAYERACNLGDIVACWEVSKHDHLSASLAATDAGQKQAADGAFAARSASLLPRLEEACRLGDVAACELVPCKECDCDGDRCEQAQHDRDLALCAKGAAKSCLSVAVAECNLDERCIAERARSPQAAVRAAFERMSTDCAAGDPDMCLALLRPPSYDELCAAHDRMACSAAERERGRATK